MGYYYWGIVKLVRHGILIPIFVGSSPAIPTITQKCYLRPNAVGSGSGLDLAERVILPRVQTSDAPRHHLD